MTSLQSMSITSGKKQFICENRCGKSYSLHYNMLRHLKHECGGQRKFECDVCFKKFTRKYHLKRHQYSVHL